MTVRYLFVLYGEDFRSIGTDSRFFFTSDDKVINRVTIYQTVGHITSKEN